MTTRPVTDQVALSLSPTEQWIVHRVLADRIDLGRRSRAAVDPPPEEVISAFGKIEAGEGWFTARELRRVLAELRWYVDRRPRSSRDRSAVQAAVERITAALNGRRRPRPSPGDGRRTRPR